MALLRGINVGRHRRVSMTDVRKAFEALGLDDVSTYLQSGNVRFASGLPATRLEALLERSIADANTPGVSVLLRTDAELVRIVRANPFDVRDVSHLHVTFLRKRPPAARARKLDPEVGAPDEFRLHGKEIYLHFPRGYGRSKLTNAYFEKQVGVVATTRNWKTVTALAELASG